MNFNSIHNLAYAALQPQIVIEYYKVLNLEAELKRTNKVKIEDVREFAKTTIFSYTYTLNFAIANGRLPTLQR